MNPTNQAPPSGTHTHTHARTHTRTHIPLHTQALKKLERELAGQLERCRSGDGRGKEQSRQGSGGSDGVEGADCVRDAGRGQIHHTHSATAGARGDRDEVGAEVGLGGGAGEGEQAEPKKQGVAGRGAGGEDEQLCEYDATVLVQSPLQGIAASLARTEGAGDDSSVPGSKGSCDLIVSGAVLVWGLGGANREEGAGGTAPVFPPPPVSPPEGPLNATAACAGAEHAQDALDFKIRVDSHALQIRRGAAKEWTCSCAPMAYAVCTFKVRAFVVGEASSCERESGNCCRYMRSSHPLSAGPHNLTVSVVAARGLSGGGKARTDKHQQRHTHEFVVGSSPTIPFEIVASAVPAPLPADGEWLRHAESWRSWMMPFYHQVAEQASLANAADDAGDSQV